MLLEFEILIVVMTALKAAESAVLSAISRVPENFEASQGHQKLQTEPTIFAITGQDALRAAAGPSGSSGPTRLRIHMKRKYLEQKRTGSKKPQFLPIFKDRLVHIISRDLQISKDGSTQTWADTIRILKDKKANVHTSVELKSASQTLILDFAVWENSENILKLLEKETLKWEQVIYNPYDGCLKVRNVNRLERLELDRYIGKYQFNICGDDLNKKSLEELTSLLDLSNMVNLSSVGFRIEKTKEFEKALQDKMEVATPGQIRSTFQTLVRSNNWVKNVVEAINYKLVPVDQSTESRIPFKPQAAKRLLDKLSRFEERLSYDDSFDENYIQYSYFQDPESVRLLMLILALIGDLMAFRESKGYFRSLLLVFFEGKIKTQNSVFEVIEDPLFERLVTFLPISSSFSSSNLGKEFSQETSNSSLEEEELEFKPLSEDSFIQMDNDTADADFHSEVEELLSNVESPY